MAEINSDRRRLPSGVQGPKNHGGRYGYRKQYLQESAAERVEFRANLTPEQQLARLDKRLGAGVGAHRERKRLHAAINKSKKSKKVEVTDAQ